MGNLSFKEIMGFLIVFLALGIVCEKLNISSLRQIKYGPHKRTYRNFKSIDMIEGKSLDYLSERMNMNPTKIELFKDYKLCTWHLSNNVIVLKFTLDDKCIKLEEEFEWVTHN